MSGALYVVSTPIGNLGDITRRAAETLGAADRVAAEDTRRTRALLSHLGIGGKPVVKLDAHAPDHVLSELVDKLLEGESVALVTDAGTPSVSDPGTELVRRAAAEGITVIAIPGASAVTAAVSVSGLVEGPFSFLGFLPRKGEKRKRLLRRIATSVEPVVLFESPNRIRETLAELAELAPSRRAVVARELTKMHEEIVRGTLSELVSRGVNERGEFTVVIEGAGEPDAADDADVDALVAARLADGESPRTIADEVADLVGRPRREIYARVLELRKGREDA